MNDAAIDWGSTASPGHVLLPDGPSCHPKPVDFERLGGAAHDASPIKVRGRIYFCNREGMTTVLSAGTGFRALATNQLTNLCLDTGDVGGIYTGRDWAARGTQLRFNHIHHLGGLNMGSNAIYLDDLASGQTIHGNIIHDVWRAMMIGGGRDNVVENNILEGEPWLDPRGFEQAEAEQRGWVRITDNLIGVDPRFVDRDGGDFRLTKNSPAREIGFQEIPMEKIGLQLDEYRRELPER